jgi:hypothetical protein
MDTDKVPDSLGPNDRAFIKVAIELRELENGLAVGEAMLLVRKRMKAGNDAISQHGYSSGGTKNFQAIAADASFTHTCAEPMKAYMGFLEGARTQFADIEPFVEKAKERIVVLQKYFDQYVAGQDIIMSKLADDS